ncbi:MAG: hypothetical protein OXL98_13160 [Acidimicrobiaceae bacterium]|nr:hypothetical protein [Acidimicrobiaceae bacterium]
MATFLEGVGSVGVACTLAALVPAVALVLVARKARLTVALYYLVGVTLLTWARASGHWDVELSGAVMSLAPAAAVAGVFVLAYWAKAPASLAAIGSGLVAGALAGWLWRPCVGPKLGEILNSTDTEAARTLGLMLVYMAGALLPAVLLAVLPHALPAVRRFLDCMPVVVVGGAVGVAYAVTLATGRYDDLVGELYRMAADT